MIHRRPFSRRLIGLFLVAWLLASTLGYFGLSSQGQQTSYWVRLDFEAWPEDRSVSFAAGGKVASQTIWLDRRVSTPMAITDVSGGGVVVRTIHADGHEVPLDELRGLDRWKTDQRGFLIIKEPGGLTLPGAVSEVRFELEAGDGRIVAETYSGPAAIAAEATARSATISSGSRPTCWVLGVAGKKSETVLQMPEATGASLLRAEMFPFSGASQVLDIRSTSNYTVENGRVEWRHGFDHARTASPRGRVMLVSTLTALLPVLLLAWLLRQGPALAQPVDARAPLSVPLMPRFLVGGLLGIHLVWALTMPIVPTNDSVEYYAMGRQIAAGAGAEALDTHRTPGYPLLIAAVLRGLGDNLLSIVLLQHTTIVGLSVLVYRLLAPTRRKLAISAAALVGLAPLTTLCANAIWTETLYTTTTSAAIAVYLFGRRTMPQFVMIGAMVGIATLLRPTGWWLGLFILAAEVIRMAQMRKLCPTSIRHLAAMGVVAAVLILPWAGVFAAREGAFGLSKAQGMTFWANSILQGRANEPEAPYNAPLRLLLAVPYSSVYGGRDPFLLRKLAAEQGLQMDDAYFMSVFRAAETAGGRSLTDRVAATAYNFTFQSNVVPPVMMIFPELDWLVSLARQKAADARVLERASLPFPTLHALTAETLPNARAAVQGLATFVQVFGLAAWPLWVVFGIFYSGLMVLLKLRPEWLVPLGWSAFAFAGPMLLGMPAQRYVMVVEPVLLLLTVVGASELLQRFPRARKDPAAAVPLTH
jgi:hypothetical protein